MLPRETTISVITVCRNSENTLGRAIRSVTSQSWPWIEHIVIDGNSTDDTLRVIESHRGCLSKVLSEPDNGIYDAMNKGLALSTGDIVCFLNSDDYYKDSDALQLAAENIVTKQLDVLFGDVEFFFASKPDVVVRRYSSKGFRPSLLPWGRMPAHPALFLRRTIVDRVGQFRTDYKIAGDFEFIVRVFSEKNVRYHYLPFTFVRMQLGGASTDGIQASWQSSKEMLRACRENSLQTSAPMIYSRYLHKLFEFGPLNLRALGNKHK